METTMDPANASPPLAPFNAPIKRLANSKSATEEQLVELGRSATVSLSAQARVYTNLANSVESLKRRVLDSLRSLLDVQKMLREEMREAKLELLNEMARQYKELQDENYLLRADVNSLRALLICSENSKV